MDVKILAQLHGVKAQSVVDHQEVEGADILRIDLKNEPELRRAIETRARDQDIFDTDRTVDGTAVRFTPDHLLKARQLNFVDPGLPGEPRIPGWRLVAEVYGPRALHGAVVERLGFYTFDRHSGSTTYDFSQPNEHLTRPWARYSLGYLEEGDKLVMLGVNPSKGNIEVNHIDTGENAQELSGTFARVQFDMPNLHEHFPQAPDRGFLVYLPSGFYRLNGTW
ncbi:hypothetical protein AYO28_27065 [Pseudomonas putida]|uniref:Uncharacterized protein n=2 Tax=Pseudomonas putida TaxID=303 RepID=A0A177S7Q5_PSEPU|nr:hypothetical protein AYO28_27065 [Pseudomonas putida]